MDTRFPIATDNIFKFYALFGLVLLVASIAAHLYLHEVESLAISDALKAAGTVEASKRLGTDLKPEEISAFAVSSTLITRLDRNHSVLGLAAWVLNLASLALTAYGFRRWHREVQPLADERERLEIELLRTRLEIARAAKANPAAQPFANEFQRMELELLQARVEDACAERAADEAA